MSSLFKSYLTLWCVVTHFHCGYHTVYPSPQRGRVWNSPIQPEPAQPYKLSLQDHCPFLLSSADPLSPTSFQFHFDPMPLSYWNVKGFETICSTAPKFISTLSDSSFQQVCALGAFIKLLQGTKQLLFFLFSILYFFPFLLLHNLSFPYLSSPSILHSPVFVSHPHPPLWTLHLSPLPFMSFPHTPGLLRKLSIGIFCRRFRCLNQSRDGVGWFFLFICISVSVSFH